MTNGNAKFTRIMINDSSSYSRVIRLTGKGTGDAAAFFEPWRIVIRDALNFRINRRGSVTFLMRVRFEILQYILRLSIFLYHQHFYILDIRTRSFRVLIRRLIPIHPLFTLVKFLIYILHRFRRPRRAREANRGSGIKSCG